MENNSHILILAAGDIRNKFAFVKNNCTSPALIPVNTRPLASYVLNRLHKLSSATKHLVIDESARNEVESELRSILNETSTRIHCVQPTQSSIETLSLAIKGIPEDSKITVLLVTTIPNELPNENEVLIDYLESHNEEWAVISENENQIYFHRKNNKNLFTGNAFTGCFTVSKTILEKAGIILKNDPKKEHTEDTSEEVILFENLDFETEETDTNKSSYHNKSIDQLHEILTKAVADEDYETAAKVRDEISKR